jgi:cardiolipin synthase
MTAAYRIRAPTASGGCESGRSAVIRRARYTGRVTREKQKGDGERIDCEYPWWMKTLAGIGIVAVVGITVTLFFSFGRRPSDIAIPYSPPVESPDFLLGVAGVAGGPLRAGGTSRLLNNGDAFFPALRDTLSAATQSINFEVYIWEKGKASDDVFAVLIPKARAGVQVRVLLDGVGGLHAPDKDFKRLEEAGGKVKVFRAPQLGKLSRFHKRNHRRAIVIDGRVAFVGGMAVGDKWLGNADREEHWRDNMVQVTGPLAATVQSAFVDNWAHVGGEILTGPAFFPEFPAPVAPPGETIALHTGVASAPSSEDHPMRLIYLQSFAAARQRLYISNSYFVPDETVRKVVVERAKHGVDVRILLPGEKTDARPIRQAGHKHFEQLLEAGVKIYEYQPTMMHAKTVVVDGKFSVVGSSNLDVRSKELNQENVLGILDAGLARQIEETFLDDLERAKQIELAEWRKRGPVKKLTERVCALFAEQY